MKKIFLSVSVLCSSFVFCQSGTRVYPFLLLPISAKQAALGGDAISLYDDQAAISADNPSLMNAEMDGKISLQAANYIAGTKYGTLHFVKDFHNGQLISLNGRYMNYGEMERTDEDGLSLGNFSASDASLGGGYAYQFEDNWTVGANINFITSKIDTFTSMAVAANAGITYHNERTNETVSVVLRNFGRQIKSYNGTLEKMPFRADIGYTKFIEKFPVAITLTAHDIQQINISADYNNNNQEVKLGRKIADHFSIGAELFPERNFNIRLGYNVKRGNELAVLDQRSFSGLSAGFGVKISYFNIDFAHVRYHNSSNMTMVGVMVDLNKNRY